jgi:arginase family enzyme
VSEVKRKGTSGERAAGGRAKTTAVFFPFHLFGSAGAGSGAELLADAFRELLADNRRETRPTRARAYQEQVQVQEFTFDQMEDFADWRQQARAAVRKASQAGQFLLWIAGNHLSVLPVYEELADDHTLVAQFDAHLDIYNLSDCKAELSHGNFLLFAERLPAIVNVGHRELLLRPEYVRRYYQQCWPAERLAIDPAGVADELAQWCASAGRVFLDLDCDVLDPAFFPAVAQPLPFGLSPHLLLGLIEAAWSGPVTGLAVSEFDPARDSNDRCLSTLLWLLEHVLLRRYEKRG